MKVLTAGQGRMATVDGFCEGVDFISYEMVPLGPRDLIFNSATQRWVDRRTTDGEVLAVDGRNAL